MRALLLKAWANVSASYWLLPGALLLAAISLAQVSLTFDARVDLTATPWLNWIVIDDPASAQTILSTVAASMITVTGAVFSITVVALTVAANQFGQRLLRNFMRDRGNQITLGVFLGTFVYALFIMRQVSTLSEMSEVPSISVCGAIGLSISSVAALIYFIHHIAASLQVENVAAAVSEEFDRCLERLNFQQCPPTSPHPSTYGLHIPQQDIREEQTVRAQRSGYLQRIDYEQLVTWARREKVVLSLKVHPGMFLFEESPLATSNNGSGIDASDRAQLSKAFVIGNQATHEQDVAYSLRQLAQIGVRALSPGINDPFTAYLCINRLGDALGKLLQVTFPTAVLTDENGEPRVTYPVATFANLVSVALGEVIEYSRSHVSVAVYLLHTIGVLATRCTRQQDRLVLWHHAERCAELCLDNLQVESVSDDIRRQLLSVRSALFLEVDDAP